MPIATYHGTVLAGSGPAGSFCRSLGHQVPFSSRKLQELYPLPVAYPPHETCVGKVRASVQQMLSGRWLEPEDAQITQKAEFTTAGLGCGWFEPLLVDRGLYDTPN